MINEFTIKTNKKEEIIDITKEVKEYIKKSQVKEGICNIFVRHTTCSIIINENYDPSVGKDLLELLENLVPRHEKYHHNDGNAHAHLRSSILGSSINIPFSNNELSLGRWQDIFLIEFDGPRDRNIIVQLIPLTYSHF